MNQQNIGLHRYGQPRILPGVKAAQLNAPKPLTESEAPKEDAVAPVAEVEEVAVTPAVAVEVAPQEPEQEESDSEDTEEAAQ